MRKAFLPLVGALCIAMTPQLSSAAPTASLAGVQAGTSLVEQATYYRRYDGGYYPRYRHYGYYPRYRAYPYYDYGYYRPNYYYRPYAYRPYPYYYRRYWY
jgi:hypothetical protein